MQYFSMEYFYIITIAIATSVKDGNASATTSPFK